MLRLGILGSRRGVDMLALIAAIQEKRLPAEIKVVISNNEDALILQHARHNNLNAYCVDPRHLLREEYDRKISMILREHTVDLVILIGYMRILSKEFIDAWRNKIINVHPSLLPEFAGKIDREVHQAVLDAKMKETGCTVHYVTEEIDAGPILVQKKCAISPTDTVDSLKSRVQQLEGEALIEALTLWREGR